MLVAVHHGNGTMAQFSHPEFGGTGQWMRGGMTMVSDMFNSQLKARVDSICSEISSLLEKEQLFVPGGSFQSQSQSSGRSQDRDNQSQSAGGGYSTSSLFVPDPDASWWPEELGAPSAVGAQNNTHYAYFARSNRLAVKTGNDTWVYDTLNHNISGFSQQQSGGNSITFSSQFGTVNLATLPVISRNGIFTTQAPQPLQNHPEPAPSTQTTQSSLARQTPHEEPPQGPQLPQTTEQILATLEKLGELLDKGYITPEEFGAKKVDLLARL